MSLFNREKFSTDLSGLIEEFGLSVFDIEYPNLSSPTLRVFISKAGKDCREIPAKAGQKNSDLAVTLDECAKVSRTISALLEEQQIEEADQWAMEVSSPGINRKLRTLQHFSGAVNERVLINFRDPQTNLNQSITGNILRVEDRNIILKKTDLTAGKKGASKKAKLLKKSGAKQDPSVCSEDNLITIAFDCIENARIDFLFK